MNREKPSLLAGLQCIALTLALVCGIPATPVHANKPAQTYIVQPGDTLLAIALRFNVSVQSLQAANSLANPDRLQVGDTLTIPATSSKTSSTGTIHIVKSGDTLLGICLQYSISLQALLDVNSLKETSLLQIGQRLQIPGGTQVNPEPPSPPQPQVQTQPGIELIPIQPDPVPPRHRHKLLLQLCRGILKGYEPSCLHSTIKCAPNRGYHRWVFRPHYNKPPRHTPKIA